MDCMVIIYHSCFTAPVIKTFFFRIFLFQQKQNDPECVHLIFQFDSDEEFWIFQFSVCVFFYKLQLISYLNIIFIPDVWQKIQNVLFFPIETFKIFSICDGEKSWKQWELFDWCCMLYKACLTMSYIFRFLNLYCHLHISRMFISYSLGPFQNLSPGGEGSFFVYPLPQILLRGNTVSSHSCIKNFQKTNQFFLTGFEYIYNNK